MFSLRDTLESGQIFRWKYVDGGALVAHGPHLFFINVDGQVEGMSKEWQAHFLREDQEELSHSHPYVQEAIKNNPGIRVMRQDPWECLVAFIVSQNNHQKRIQANVMSIAETFGEEIAHGMHRFPLPHKLGDEEEFRKLGLGYRAKHLAALRELDLAWLHSLSDLTYEDAKKELQTLSGVGPKVADCILLFSLGFDEACPEDTWIKKIFKEHGLDREMLGPKAGLIQQFLFHHARSKKS